MDSTEDKICCDMGKQSGNVTCGKLSIDSNRQLSRRCRLKFWQCCKALHGMKGMLFYTDRIQWFLIPFPNVSTPNILLFKIMRCPKLSSFNCQLSARVRNLKMAHYNVTIALVTGAAFL